MPIPDPARRFRVQLGGPVVLTRVGDAFVEYQPHERYKGFGLEPLNRYGLGPFCKFKVPGLPRGPGLYAFVVDGIATYIGKTVDFGGRMGPVNYGSISPKNCYRSGQSTNCKINSRVLQAAKAGQTVALYVVPNDGSGCGDTIDCSDRPALERQSLKPTVAPPVDWIAGRWE